jgi:hypothetical protein
MSKASPNRPIRPILVPARPRSTSVPKAPAQEQPRQKTARFPAEPLLIPRPPGGEWNKKDKKNS